MTYDQAVVEQQIDNSAFTVEALTTGLNLSRMQLHRKLKALTDQSATEFVRHLRLQRAADLLAGRNASVSEVAYRVGFESLSYFTEALKDQFGIVPSEYDNIHRSAAGQPEPGRFVGTVTWEKNNVTQLLTSLSALFIGLYYR